ncbi:MULTISPECIES: rhodanese-like domain-containing protein [Clostridium]|uniref:rhodanese-like domain-containing protein n=1 Tax=Clostridium TaxID=1485 RepID=UPI00069F2F59|nr:MULTISPECIES: rhodanese-like domain-containing protein [Clostridium]KOF56840.1 sulfurtransferase [Clostridium sp. DMHC 10]MCD2347789.1 rhodanese-like domain-containing protein [Clostridium guangxiense]
MFSFLNKNKFKSIDISELENLRGKITLIDVRNPEEYREGHVPGAKNAPMNFVLQSPEKYLNKSKEYYIICQSGMRSAKTCGKLSDMGFNVVNVKGGTSSYNGNLQK